MATEGILRIVDGNVRFYNSSNMLQKVYYSGGNAVRADWYDKINESVQVWLSDSRILIINQGAQIVKRYPA